MRTFCKAVVLALTAVACTTGSPSSGPSADAPYAFPPAPSVPASTSLPEDVIGPIQRLPASLLADDLDVGAVGAISRSGDPRLAWFLADLLRFVGPGREQDALVQGFRDLTGVDPASDPAFAASPWQSITNHLIVWDLPAPPGYREMKAELFVAVEPGWEPFFADADADIDWRWLSWGGVFIDDRPPGDRQPCPRGCIPALDDPPLTDAAGGAWYPDERIVFGVVLGDEAVAFPKNVMEIHEMVNITIGGVRLGIPYCTLCGSIQAYRTDVGRDEPLVLRTSGLLSRSNKVMFDLATRSVFDTFTGRALSGPLQDEGLTLEQVTVVTSTWGEWKRDHPDTRIVERGGGLGGDYPLDPLGGRDDDGPIFPIGQADPRLAVQTLVIGVIAPDGGAVAFPAEAARSALDDGSPVRAAGVELTIDAGGVRATADGSEVPAHQAFWFAWSQFHPETVLWAP
jgi:hypothetical protein